MTQAVFDATEGSILNKTVTIRPDDHPWIICHLKALKPKRKRLNKSLNAHQL